MKKISKILLIVLCVVMLAGCGTVESGDNKEEPTAEPTATPDPKPQPVSFTWEELPAESNELYVAKLKPTVNGRYYGSATSYTFNYNTGGVTFGFTGTSLSIDFAKCGAWISCYVDDMDEKVIIASEKGFYEVASGLDPNVIHSVTIAKRDESNTGTMVIKSVKIDEGAKFYNKKYESKRKRIEVLGDSISCGYGNLYGTIELKTSDYREMENGNETFATMLCDYYDADLCMCCISGIGVGNAANSPWPILPSYKSDGTKKHDFTKDIPDLVIIELGENDQACGNTGEEFINNGKALVEFIRGNYPEVPIIWYYGIMNTGMYEQIGEIVKSFNDAGDNNIYYLKTIKDDNEPQGGAGHPSVVTMKRMSEELIEFIRETLKW